MTSDKGHKGTVSWRAITACSVYNQAWLDRLSAIADKGNTETNLNENQWSRKRMKYRIINAVWTARVAIAKRIAGYQWPEDD